MKINKDNIERYIGRIVDSTGKTRDLIEDKNQPLNYVQISQTILKI